MTEKEREDWLKKLVAQAKQTRRSRAAGQARRRQPGSDIQITPSEHFHRPK